MHDKDNNIHQNQQFDCTNPSFFSRRSTRTHLPMLPLRRLVQHYPGLHAVGLDMEGERVDQATADLLQAGIVSLPSTSFSGPMASFFTRTESVIHMRWLPVAKQTRLFITPP